MIIEKPASLWASTAIPSEDHETLTENAEADVTVIGAGFTGLRSALMLSENGSKVIVLDAGDVAYGASGRTGGQVNPLLPFNSPEKLQKLLGATYFDRLTETSLGSADELFRMIEKYQIDCQARQKGWIRACHNRRALRDAESGVAEWNKFGANMSILSRDELTQRTGTTAYEAGVVTPGGGAVQPMSLAIGIADAAKKRGCAIFGNSAVQSIERENGKWLVSTKDGSVKSHWVIVATNGYSDKLVPKLDSSILPVTPVQIATEPLPESVIGTILPNGETISDSRRVIMYARREPDNRMVYGSHGKILANGEIANRTSLIEDAVRVFPQLANVKWTFGWGGRIAITEDHLPHLHEPQPGLLVGLGYNGRGVAMSNVMGRVLAERVLGASVQDLAFPVSPIRKVPFRPIKLAGVGAAVWYLRLLDRLET